MTPTPHVFLTRFNIPANKTEISLYNPDWLSERMELFEKFTVPSVRSQESSERYWIVYLHLKSPDWLRRRIGELESEGLLKAYWIARPLRDGEVHENVMEVTGRTQGRVTTSNLDNDDALAADYVARLRQSDPGGERRAIYFANGLVVSGRQLRLLRYPENAFVAVAESLDSPGFLGAWSEWHNRLGLHMPVDVVEGEPAWMQVIHGRNVSNRVRGRLVSPIPHIDKFPMIADVRIPSRREVLVDAAIAQNVRGGRDMVRGVLAKSGRKLLGQKRVDSLKYRLHIGAKRLTR